VLEEIENRRISTVFKGITQLVVYEYESSSRSYEELHLPELKEMIYKTKYDPYLFARLDAPQLEFLDCRACVMLHGLVHPAIMSRLRTLRCNFVADLSKFSDTIQGFQKLTSLTCNISNPRNRIPVPSDEYIKLLTSSLQKLEELHVRCAPPCALTTIEKLNHPNIKRFTLGYLSEEEITYWNKVRYG